MKKGEKLILGMKYRTVTMMKVSHLLGYGFNGTDVAKMLNLNRQSVQNIRFQLKHIFKIRDSHNKRGKE